MATKEIHFAQAVIECKICDKGNNIEWKCVTCGEIMCTSCKTFHLRSKALRNHRVLHINDINERLDAAPSEVDIPVQCKIHPNEQVHMFCEPCDELVCHDCIGGKHKGHIFVKISKVANQKKSELQGYIAKAKEKLTVNQRLNQTATSGKKEYTATTRECSTSLKEKSANLKFAIDKVTKDMEAELQQGEKRNQTTCDTMKKGAEKEISEIQEFIKTCESKMSAPSTEMIQFLSKAKETLSNFKDIKSPEQLPSPTFVPGDIGKISMRDLIGFIGYSKEVQNYEATHPKPIYKAKLISSFQTENNVNRMCSSDDDTFWMGAIEDPNITLVTSKGKVIKSINTGLKVYDFKVHLNGNLLLTEYHGCSVKMMSKNSKTIIDLCDLSPFYTYGIDFTQTGDIIVGLCNLQSNGEGKIVRISPKGKVLESLQYASDRETSLFQCPAQPVQMRNGNLFVLNIDEDNRRSIIFVDWSGNIKFEYTGIDEKMKTEQSFNHISVDALDNIIVTDTGTETIQILDQYGHFIQYLLSPDNVFDDPLGLHIDQSGYLWISDFGQRMIHKLKYLP